MNIKEVRNINDGFLKMLGLEDELITKLTIVLTPDCLPVVKIEKILEIKNTSELVKYEYELRLK